MNVQTTSVAGRSPARRTCCCRQDFDRLLEFCDLAFLFTDDPRRLGRSSPGLTPVDLGLTDPLSSGLRGHPQSRRYRLDRGTLGRIVLTMIENQPHGLRAGRCIELRWHDLHILSRKGVHTKHRAIHLASAMTRMSSKNAVSAGRSGGSGPVDARRRLRGGSCSWARTAPRSLRDRAQERCMASCRSDSSSC